MLATTITITIRTTTTTTAATTVQAKAVHAAKATSWPVAEREGHAVRPSKCKQLAKNSCILLAKITSRLQTCSYLENLQTGTECCAAAVLPSVVPSVWQQFSSTMTN